MRPIFLLFLFVSFISSSNSDLDSTSVEEVVVYGIRQGPDLWKVSNGENVLWIMGTLSPLPKKMKWHSELVEAKIEESQALILPPKVTADVGFFQGISLASSAIGIKKNPDKKELVDVLPKEIYKRWAMLKQKYLGESNKIEKSRPLFASNQLFSKAVEKNGLTYDTKVEKKLIKFAKKHDLQLVRPNIVVKLENAKSAIKDFKKSQLDDLECFVDTLDILENDMENLRLRANAWAEGDVSGIHDLKLSSELNSCRSTIMNSRLAKEIGISDIQSKLSQLWLNEAIKALNQNQSTFAFLPIQYLLEDKYFLSKLEDQGFTIKVPK